MQMLVIVTATDELWLFTEEGDQLERGTVRGEQEGVGALIYHTNIMNALGKPEEAYQSSLSVRGAASYLMGPHKLWRARLLPRQERTKLAVKQVQASGLLCSGAQKLLYFMYWNISTM